MALKTVNYGNDTFTINPYSVGPTLDQIQGESGTNLAQAQADAQKFLNFNQALFGGQGTNTVGGVPGFLSPGESYARLQAIANGYTPGSSILSLTGAPMGGWHFGDVNWNPQTNSDYAPTDPRYTEPDGSVNPYSNNANSPVNAPTYAPSWRSSLAGQLGVPAGTDPGQLMQMMRDRFGADVRNPTGGLSQIGSTNSSMGAMQPQSNPSPQMGVMSTNPNGPLPAPPAFTGVPSLGDPTAAGGYVSPGTALATPNQSQGPIWSTGGNYRVDLPGTQTQITSGQQDAPSATPQNASMAAPGSTPPNSSMGLNPYASGGATSGYGGTSGAAPGSNTYPSTGASGSSYYNPYLASQIGQLGQQYGIDFQRNILPQITSDAQMAGGYGGSRQGVAEGIAAGDSMRNFGNAAMGLLGSDYENQQSRNLMNQGQMMNFYTAQRGQDLNNLMAGASIYGNGVNGMFAPLQAASNIYSGYTGFPTTTTSQGGGAMGAMGGALAGTALWNYLNGKSTTGS